MARKAHVFIALALSGGLAACATGNCDPAQTGYFDGLGCAASGAYGVREQSLRSRAAEAQSSELRAQADASAASLERTRAEQQLADRRAALRRMDGQIAALRSRVDAAERGNTIDQARLLEARRQLDALRQQREATPQQPDDAELRALDARREQLQRILVRP